MFIMIMIIKFVFNLCNFSVISVLLTKLLTLGISFTTAVNAIFVAKLLTSGTLFSNSVSFASLTKSVRSEILLSNFVMSVLTQSY